MPKEKKLLSEIVLWIEKNRDAEVLSRKYKNNTTELKIKCKFGHVFPIIWSNIQKGHFCPECSEGICERICRMAFQKIFKTKFQKIRPATLLSDKGYRMELDGYAEVLVNKQIYKIAFEHQGRHHEEKNHKFHKNTEEFYELAKRDTQKEKWCKENNIILIKIPEIFTKLSIHNLNIFLKNEFAKYNMKIKDFDIETVLKKSWESPKRKEKFDKIQEIVKKNKGKLCSFMYVAAKFPIEIKCKRGHSVKTNYDKLTRGHFCKKCRTFDEFIYSVGFFKKGNRFVVKLKKCYVGYFKTKKEAFVAHKVATYMRHKYDFDKKKIQELTIKKVKNHLNLIFEILKNDPKMKKLIDKEGII